MASVCLNLKLEVCAKRGKRMSNWRLEHCSLRQGCARVGYTFLVSLGFNMVLVNFRGSLGFGEDSIQSLPGHIGSNDVADCIACLDAAVETGTPILYLVA